MTFNSRNFSVKAFALFLCGAVLLAEYALIAHAIEHSFADSDEVCFVCEKADHFQNTLIVSVGLVGVTPTAGFEADSIFKPRFIAFQGLYQPRAPPG